LGLHPKLCINVYISKKQKTFSGHFTSGLKFSIICIETLLSCVPLKMGGSSLLFLKANFKAKNGTFLINYINFEIQLYFLRMLSFKKIQNGEKKLTGSELNKIKYHIKWPKIHQKNYLFVILYKTETCKESKFLLLSNLDCKNIYMPSKFHLICQGQVSRTNCFVGFF